MDIEEIRSGDIVIVVPHGKLDTQTEAAFEKKLRALLDEQVLFLVIDLGKVDYVSGGALRALLLATRRLKSRGGSLILCRVSGVVHQAFVIAGFDRVFVIVPSRDDAIQALVSPADSAPAELPPGSDGDDRVSRIAALALPLLTGEDPGATGGQRLPQGEPPTLPAGLGDLVCRILSETSGGAPLPRP